MDSLTKNIVICSDGTGNTGIKDRGTNVFKLFEAVDVNGQRTHADWRRQLAFYDDGVGTENLKWVRIFAGATGYGLSRNVKQLYREICRVYEPGDAIYLFGFSRGAFTVRTLSGLINDCGILDPTDCATEGEFRARVRAAYQTYRRKYRALLTRFIAPKGVPADEFRRQFARKDVSETPVRFLGVWDTVDAVGAPFRIADFWNRFIWRYKFETSTLCGVVQTACHALALDDERASFTPVLWDERDPVTRSRVEQVWFSGAHSNVGGGYPQQGMSLVALDWMMTKAEENGLRFVTSVREQYRTQHSFSDKLYDPRSGLGVFYRWKPRDVTDLCAANGIHTPKIHVSAIERIVQAPEGYAPGNLPSNAAVVTTEANPMVHLDKLGRALAAAHGSANAATLLHSKKYWVRVGAVSYAAFIGGVAMAVLRTLLAHFRPLPASVDTLVDQATTLVTSFPFGLVNALAHDSIALWSLGLALIVGYVLSAMSANRMRRYYSGFWHGHRAALRNALRRTPPPSTEELKQQAAVETSEKFVGV